MFNDQNVNISKETVNSETYILVTDKIDGEKFRFPSVCYNEALSFARGLAIGRGKVVTIENRISS